MELVIIERSTGAAGTRGGGAKGEGTFGESTERRAGTTREEEGLYLLPY